MSEVNTNVREFLVQRNSGRLQSANNLGTILSNEQRQAKDYQDALGIVKEVKSYLTKRGVKLEAISKTEEKFRFESEDVPEDIRSYVGKFISYAQDENFRRSIMGIVNSYGADDDLKKATIDFFQLESEIDPRLISQDQVTNYLENLTLIRKGIRSYNEEISSFSGELQEIVDEFTPSEVREDTRYGETMESYKSGLRPCFDETRVVQEVHEILSSQLNPGFLGSNKLANRIKYGPNSLENLLALNELTELDVEFKVHSERFKGHPKKITKKFSFKHNDPMIEVFAGYFTTTEFSLFSNKHELVEKPVWETFHIEYFVGDNSVENFEIIDGSNIKIRYKNTKNLPNRCEWDDRDWAVGRAIKSVGFYVGESVRVAKTLLLFSDINSKLHPLKQISQN